MNVFASIRSELKTPRDVWKKNRKLPDQLELFALLARDCHNTLPTRFELASELGIFFKLLSGESTKTIQQNLRR